jgi:hypothetical protein
VIYSGFNLIGVFLTGPQFSLITPQNHELSPQLLLLISRIQAKHRSSAVSQAALSEGVMRETANLLTRWVLLFCPCYQDTWLLVLVSSQSSTHAR